MSRDAIKAAMTACIGFTGVLAMWSLLAYSLSGGLL
jgi:hypothetical protein